LLLFRALTQIIPTTDAAHSPPSVRTLLLYHKKIEVMKIIFFLISLSLIVATGFLIAFLWATKTGQFDDDYTPSVRMLFDNENQDEIK
jgi:cbb3-type cytochrome oxidase maturation protein